MHTISRVASVTIATVFVFLSVFSVLFILSQAPYADAADTVIDFEGLPCFTPITTQYFGFGVTFTGATILTKLECLNYTQFPPFSGVNVLYDDPFFGLGGVITATFNSTVGDVRKVSARVTGNRNVTLTAVSADGIVLSTAQTGGANYIGSISGIPSNLLLTVESSATPIAKVTFHDSGNTYSVDDFTFSGDTAATLTVIKNVINDNGGTKTASDFFFIINNGNPIIFNSNGQNQITLPVGTYNVIEVTASGYTTFYNNCSNIQLSAGDSAICTITNDDIPSDNHSPTLSFLEDSPDGLSENDGIQDNKGAADKTQFDFDVIYTDKDNDAPLSVKLVIQKVNQGGFEDYFDSEMLPFSPQADYLNGKIYTLDRMFSKGDYRYRFEASDGVSNIQTPFTEFTVGYSNVAFLPGFEGSRLYGPDPDGPDNEDQLWEPTRNQDVEQLYMDSQTGASLDSEVYTRDIIDEAYIPLAGPNFYKSFIQFMDNEMEGTIVNDWKALPYDWRLDYNLLLERGEKIGGNLYYNHDVQTDYILNELRQLAEDSDTGKVTIITHSNGGLVTKYLLMQLENVNHPYHYLLEKIDKLIMVAAPQIGIPEAIEGLLHGDGQQLPGEFGLLVDEERVRELGENMQSAYNLLPSQKYFETVQSPVLEFDDSVSRISELANRSGTQVTTFESMRRFLEGDATRNQPDANDEEYPNVLKPHFISRAVQNHNEILDGWTPAPNIEVIQIGGWGIKTIRGMKYSCGLLTCLSLSTLDREILRTHEGDGTVVIPSAVAMTTSSNVEKYYLNIWEYNRGGLFLKRNYNHSSIFGVDSLQSFIKNLIQEDETLTDNISTTIPPIGNLTALDYIIHSPVEIHLYDSEGNHTGLIPNPLADSDLRAYEARIPNSYYREYGEVKYAGSDTFATTTVVLLGEALGTFTFEIEETLGDEIINTLSFVDIPIASSTKATLAIQNIQTASALQLDVEGDGVVDFSLTPSQGASLVMSLSIFERVVRTLGFEKGIAQSIIAKIITAKESLERGNKEAARGQLDALVYYLRAQTGKQLDATTAETLIEIIGRIQVSVIK